MSWLMPVRNIERELQALTELRNSVPAEACEGELRKALRDKVNVIAAKAAKLAAEMQMKELIPDLRTAFERMLMDPLKTDPKCWGKEAIAQALKDLGHAESAIYMKGAQHVQLE